MSADLDLEKNVKEMLDKEWRPTTTARRRSLGQVDLPNGEKGEVQLVIEADEWDRILPEDEAEDLNLDSKTGDDTE